MGGRPEITKLSRFNAPMYIRDKSLKEDMFAKTVYQVTVFTDNKKAERFICNPQPSPAAVENIFFNLELEIFSIFVQKIK